VITAYSRAFIPSWHCCVNEVVSGLLVLPPWAEDLLSSKLPLSRRNTRIFLEQNLNVATSSLNYSLCIGGSSLPSATGNEISYMGYNWKSRLVMTSHFEFIFIGIKRWRRQVSGHVLRVASLSPTKGQPPRWLWNVNIWFAFNVWLCYLKVRRPQDQVRIYRHICICFPAHSIYDSC